MIPSAISSGGRAAQARLNSEKAAEFPPPPAIQSEADDGAAVALSQRLVQASDEMSAALTQFRVRRHFELKSEGVPDNFERVLEDDVLPKVQQLLRLAPLADPPVAGLLSMARKLFADDSDLALVVRELLRRKKLEAGTRQRLEKLLQSVIASAHRHLGTAISRFVPGHPIAGSEQRGPGAAQG